MRIGLVSCVKTKASSQQPAEDLYRSPYFLRMKRYVLATCDDWRIISALYGLVHPRQMIAPYDVTLTDMPIRERKQWAEAVAGQVRGSFPDALSTIIEVHGGAAYTEHLVPLLRDAGYRAELPTPRLSFGKRLQWYDRHTPHFRGEEQSRPTNPLPPRIQVSSGTGATCQRPADHRVSPTSRDFERALWGLLKDAAQNARDHVDIDAGGLHRLVGGYPGTDHRLATCCSVMRQNMKNGDRVLAQPPRGVGARLLVRYELPR